MRDKVKLDANKRRASR